MPERWRDIEPNRAQLSLYGYFTCTFNTGRDAIRVFVYKKFFAKNIHFIFRTLALCISCQKFYFESKYCAFTSILYINLAINRLVSGNWPITHYLCIEISIEIILWSFSLSVIYTMTGKPCVKFMAIASCIFLIFVIHLSSALYLKVSNYYVKFF